MCAAGRIRCLHANYRVPACPAFRVRHVARVPRLRRAGEPRHRPNTDETLSVVLQRDGTVCRSMRSCSSGCQCEGPVDVSQRRSCADVPPQYGETRATDFGYRTNDVRTAPTPAYKPPARRRSPQPAAFPTPARLRGLLATDLSAFLALAYCTALPFDFLTVAGRSLPFWIGIVYVVVHLANHAYGRSRARTQPSAPIVLAFAYLCWCTVSLFWTIEGDQTLARVFTLAQVVLIAALLSADLPRVLHLVPTGYSLISSILAVMVLRSSESITGRRTALGDANEVALTLFVGSALSLWAASGARGLGRALWIALGILQVLAALATGSRSSLIAAAISAAVFAALLVGRERGRGVLVVGALLGLGYWLAGHIPAQFVPERVLHIRESLKGGDLSSREGIWSAALSDQLTLFGHGAGASAEYLLREYGHAYAAHNIWIGSLIEVGIFGTSLLAGVVLASAWTARRGPASTVALVLLVMVMVSGLALTLEGRRILWFAFALCWAIHPPSDRSPVLARATRSE